MIKINPQRLKQFLLFATTLAIFIFLFSKIDLPKFLKTLERINLFYFFAAVAFFLLNEVLLTSLQWQRCLSVFKCFLPLKEAIIIKLGNFPLKAILPLKCGDLGRAVYLKKQKGVSFLAGASSLYINLILNLLVLVVIMCFWYIFFRKGIFYSLLFCFVLVLLSVALALSYGPVKRGVLYLAGRISLRLRAILEPGLNIYDAFSLKDLSALFLYSIVMWSGDLFKAFLLFKSVGVDAPFYAIAVSLPLVILISNIPVTISGLGTREAAILFFFSGIAAPEKLLGAGILLSFVDFLLPLMISAFFFRKFLRQIT